MTAESLQRVRVFIFNITWFTLQKEKVVRGVQGWRGIVSLRIETSSNTVLKRFR